MTQITAQLDNASSPAKQPRRRGFFVQVLGETFLRIGARIGGVWVAVLVLAAVSAPFIATSFPYFVRYADGSWAMPLLRYLSPLDVMLPVLLVLGVVLFFIKRWTIRRRLLIWLATGFAVFMAVSLIAYFSNNALFSPPATIYYPEFREKLREGEITQAVWAPIPYSPGDRLFDDRDMVHPTPPSSQFPMGTERYGATVLSNMLHASRIALMVGFIATGIGVFIGVIIGGLMGYFSGIVDLLGMRLVEVFEAIPQLFLLLAFVAFFPDDPELNLLGITSITIPRIYMIMGIIGLTGWVGYARFTRAEFLKLRQQDFVMAARACGLPLRSILFRHMLPNGITPVLVMASFGVASAILAEATLSFLGLGLKEEPSWGQLLSQAVSSSGSGFNWWLAIYPGMAIFLTVFAYNLIGEAARDVIDPHTRKA